MTHDNKLQVEAIKRGTVIDHIPAQVGFKLLTLFKLTETDQRITIGLNLPSGEMGRKDLIKIENTFLTDEQVNQLSLYAPQATVNRIDDYDVVGKSRPSLPERIDNVLVCPNSNCISHAEPVSSSFAVKNVPMTSHSNANTVKRVFALCGAGQLIGVGYEIPAPVTHKHSQCIEAASPIITGSIVNYVTVVRGRSQRRGSVKDDV